MTILTCKAKQIDFAKRTDAVLQSLIKQLIPSNLSSAMAYSLLAGGKRIRSSLVYATGSLFNVPLEKLDAPAAAIECIHTYSLIHDDLPAMDNDNLRRGKPACHIKFGETHAVLAGDALQTFAFQTLSEAEGLSAECKVSLINELTIAAGANGMCAGQILDIETRQKEIDIIQLKKIYFYKTGLLIRAAVRFGFLCAGNIALPYKNTLDDYAAAIGLAFQIQDDILNITGDQDKMGKPKGSDKALEKSTYPDLLGLTDTIAVTRRLHEQATNALAGLPYNCNTLQALADFIIQRDT